MQEMSAEFRDRGTEVYLPAEADAAAESADAGEPVAD
jgi:hypothetical protein